MFKQNIKYLILLLAVSGLAFAASAEKLTNGSTTIYTEIDGGGTKLGTTLYNSITPLGAQFGTTGTTIIPGILGLLNQVTDVAGVPYGTVPLYISRAANGTDIVISWEASYVNPKIYALSGNGTGVYTNTNAGWVLVLAAQRVEVNSPPTAIGYFTYVIGNNYILHNAQVGAGTSECYYKGFQSYITNPLTDRHPTYSTPIFGSAEAVGKVNLTLGANKYTLVNIPLDLKGKTFGSDVTLVMPNGSVQYKDSSGSLKQASFTNGISDSPNVQVELSNGFWFKSNEDRIATFIGYVKKDSFSRDLGGRYNLFGFPFPRLVNVNAGELGIGPGQGDTMQSPNDSGILLQYYYNGSQWDDQNIKIKALRGFWYFNNSASPRTFSAQP